MVPAKTSATPTEKAAMKPGCQIACGVASAMMRKRSAGRASQTTSRLISRVAPGPKAPQRRAR